MSLTPAQIDAAEQSSLGAPFVRPGVFGAAWLPKPSQYIVEGHAEIAAAIAELGAGATITDLCEALDIAPGVFSDF